MPDEHLADDSRRLVTRRSFLKAAAALPVVTTAGCSSVAQQAHSSSPGARLDVATATSPQASGFNPEPIKVLKPGKTAPGYIFINPAHLKGYQAGCEIVDNSGQLVWSRPISKGLLTTNLQVQRYKGEPCLTWWMGKNILPGYGRGHYFIADSSYRVVKQVYAGNGLMGDLHEFVLTDRNTALFTAFKAQPADLSSVGGPTSGKLLNAYFQEIDLDSGKVLFQWAAYPHVGLKDSYNEPIKKSNKVWDYFHINSIDIDTDGNYLISSRHTWSLYKIDSSSGEIIWTLNGKRSDFKMGPKSHFAWQHHARHHGAGQITLFDDAAGATGVAFEKQSRGLTLQLDYKKMTADMVHQYLPNPTGIAGSEGSMQLLPNGDVFIGWGALPYFSEYTLDERQIYNAALPKGGHSYRAFRFEWVGKPSTAPSVSASRSKSGELVVEASWNGATEVRHWVVLAGRPGEKLKAIGTFQREGFETQMTVTTSDSHVAVEALDAKKSSLGRSRTVVA